MSGPSDSQIWSLANSWNVNPASVFSYAAYNQGQTPANLDRLNGFIASETSVAAGLNTDIRLLYGYVTQNGSNPTHDQLVNYAKQAGYMDTAGNLVSIPAAGQNFLYDIAVTNPNANPPTATPNSAIGPPSTALPLGLPNLSGLLQNKVALAGAAVAVLYVVNPGHWRGR